VGGNTRELGRTSSSRLLSLIGAFSSELPAMSLTQIAHEAELPVSTAHRLLNELVGWGAVERDREGRYHVGAKLAQIGSLAPRRPSLRELASPFMEDLHEVTHENVQLAVRDGRRALNINHILGRRSVGMMTQVAGHMPLHATAVGKVILAFSEPELLEALVGDGLQACTIHTITSPGRLIDAVRNVRRRHLAFAREEMSLGTSSVAAPIFDAEQRLAGAMAIVIGSTRDTTRFAPALRAATLGVTRALSQRAAVARPTKQLSDAR
jgi:DNA-binding IclR family transcriptional regulator